MTIAFNERTFDWKSHRAVSLRKFDVNFIGHESNHLDGDPKDFATLRNKLRRVTIDGVAGTEVPITAFVSGIHEEWFGNTHFPKQVVINGAASFGGMPSVFNHSFDVKDVIGRILVSKGVEIDEDNSKIIMKVFITDETAQTKLWKGELQEVSVAMFVDEDFEEEEDEDGTPNAINFTVTAIRGEHIGFVQRGAVSPGDGAGVGVGTELEELARKRRTFDASPPEDHQEDSVLQSLTPASGGGTTMSDDDNDPADPSSGDDAMKARLKALQAELAEAGEREAAMKASFDKTEAENATFHQKEKDKVIAELVERTGKDADFFKEKSTDELTFAMDMLPEVKKEVPPVDTKKTRNEGDPRSYLDKGKNFEIPVLRAVADRGGSRMPNFATESASADELTHYDSWEPTDEAIALMADRRTGVLMGLQGKIKGKLKARVDAYLSG